MTGIVVSWNIGLLVDTMRELISYVGGLHLWLLFAG